MFFFLPHSYDMFVFMRQRGKVRKMPKRWLRSKYQKGQITSQGTRSSLSFCANKFVLAEILRNLQRICIQLQKRKTCLHSSKLYPLAKTKPFFFCLATLKPFANRSSPTAAALPLFLRQLGAGKDEGLALALATALMKPQCGHGQQQ